MNGSENNPFSDSYNPYDQPMMIQEVDVPLGERIVIGVQKFFELLSGGLAAIVLAFIVPIRVLFTTKKDILVPIPEFMNAPTQVNLNLPPAPGGDDDEDWKKKHREEFGND